MNCIRRLYHPLSSPTTEVGRQILRDHPETTGSLGCAISEAVESAVQSGGAKRYVLGSVLNQVLLHQSIIGLESKLAMEQLGEYPDVVVGCAGGGSNLGGLIAPFMADKLRGYGIPHRGGGTRLLPLPSPGASTPTISATPAGSPRPGCIPMAAASSPSANHAGGLRYHGMSPILSKLYHDLAIWRRWPMSRPAF